MTYPAIAHTAESFADVTDAEPTQHQLFGSVRPPVLAAWGGGVNSTAMLIEMIVRGEPVDHVLLADAGGENPRTYVFIDLFREWMRVRGVPSTIVRYSPRNYKNWPPYRTLEENCLTNGTLPSLAFGFGACSQKWKIAPQNRWAESWVPAREVWAASGKVIKLIGYDCSPADCRRYAEREGYTDSRYVYRYPLREWGWKREQCVQRIADAHLPVPPKSACFFLCLHEMCHLIVSLCEFEVRNGRLEDARFHHLTVLPLARKRFSTTCRSRRRFQTPRPSSGTRADSVLARMPPARQADAVAPRSTAHVAVIQAL